MTAINYQRSFQVIFFIFAIGFLTACGSSKTSGDGFDGATNTNTSASTTPSNNAKAICSQNVTGTGGLGVRLMQVVDDFNQVRPDMIRVQIRQAPPAWKDGNWDLVIYRWSVSTDGATSIDRTPLKYQFQKKVSGRFQYLTPQATAEYEVFNYDEIQAMGQHAGISAATPQEFFNTASLLVNLKDSTNSYQVLRVVLLQAGTVAAQSDILIPAFDADPAIYNADSRHPAVLQNLHPLKDKLGQTWSQNQYQEFAKSFCF